MLELRTLGVLDLKHADGSAAHSILAQPKRAALLVYLCVSDPGAYHRRDTLLPMFWPEHDELSARHALGQALYTLRRSLGAAVVETRGNDELRVRTGAVCCDATLFQEAATNRRWADALDLYRGDFLRSLHIRGADGFERWTEGERARLRQMAAAAGWSQAREQVSRGALTEAQGSATRALRLAPADERSARVFIAALANAGAPATALRFYDLLSAVLHEELAVEPTIETRELAQGVRKGVGAVRHHASAHGKSAASIPPIIAPGKEPEDRLATQGIGRARSRRVVLGGALLLLGLAAVWSLTRPRTRPRTAVSPARIAVFPFSVPASAGFADLREGLMDLLSDALDGAGEVRPVDPNVIMHRLGGGAASVDLESALRIAHELGAGHFVLGRITDLRDRVLVSASLYPVPPRGESLLRSVHEGAVKEIPALVDSLARDVLTSMPAVAGEFSGSPAALGTGDYVALRHYLRGQAQLRRREIDSACTTLREAVREDSSFALAWLRLAESEEWGCSPTDIEAIPRVIAAWEHAYRLRDRLSRRDQLFLATAYAHAHGQGPRAQRAALEMVAAYPDAVEGWRYLGDIRWTDAWQLGPSATPGPEAPYLRALALDPEDRLALNGLALVAYHAGRKARGDSLWMRATDGNWVVPPEDSAGRSRFLAGLGTRRQQGVVNAVRVVSLITDSLTDARRIAALLTDPGRSDTARSLGHLLAAWVELARGRWRAANTEFRSADSLEPGTGVLEKAWFGTFPFFQLDSATLAGMRDSLLAWVTPTRHNAHAPLYFAGGDGRLPQWLLQDAKGYVLGLLSARLGDRDGAARYAAQLEHARRSADSVGLLHDLALEVRALAVAQSGDWEGALQVLEGAGLRIATEFDGFDSPFGRRPLGRLLRAEALYHLGRYDEALAWYRAFGWTWEEEVEVAPVQLRIGEICERSGDPAAAVLHYRRFLARWRNAEAGLQPLPREVEARVGRLTARSGPRPPGSSPRQEDCRAAH